MASADDVWVEYTDALGTDHQGQLSEVWSERFEQVRPHRGFPSFRGQRNWCGWYWAATCSAHVGYESWLERDQLMLLDFDPFVAGVASQPFRLSWQSSGSRRTRHTPDYFVRQADGTALVVDVRPDDRIPAADAAKFDRTGQACASVGWGFRRVGVPDPLFMANVRWLAGYRHPRVRRPEVVDALAAVFAESGGLRAGAAQVGDPIAVLPVLFHLLWHQELTTDLHADLLNAASVVHPGDQAGGAHALTSARAASG